MINIDFLGDKGNKKLWKYTLKGIKKTFYSELSVKGFSRVTWEGLEPSTQ